MLSIMKSRKRKIWEAARDGKQKTISRLLPDATTEDLQYEGLEFGYRISALIVAASNGHLEIVQKLLQSNKFDINQKSSEDEYTALMLASKYGHLSLVEYLIQQGAEINMQDNVGTTALLYASINGHLPVLEYLVQQGADIHIHDKDGDTALLLASKNNHLPVVQYLIQQGADINTQNEEGFTAFLNASLDGHLSVVKYLVQQGVDINAQNEEGNVALMGASINGHLSVVQYLVQQGADINTDDGYGTTALMGASLDGHLSVVQYLVQQGVDINAQNKEGRTALIYASISGHHSVVEYLVQQGADINTDDGEGATALMLASIDGHLPVVEYLVQQGAAINTQDKDGDTTVMYASRNGHLPVVEYLLQQGAAIDIQNEDGDTALLLACREGNKDVVKVLLQAGAEKNIQNKKGETALSVAKTEEIKKILVKYDLKESKTLQSPPVNSAVAKTAEMRQPLEEYSQKGASKSHTVVQKPVSPHKSNKLHTQTDAVITSAQNILSSNETSPMRTHTATPPPAETTAPSRKHNIWEAARDGGKETISRLLPQATAEDLQYEAKEVVWKMTALIVAAYNGHLDIVQMLLHSKKVDVNLKSSEDGITALTFASKNGHLPVVQYLVQQGADINMQDKDGITALTFASKNGYLPVVQYLVQQGAAINMQDKFGFTALRYTSRHGHLPVVQYLVQQGADINMQDRYEKTALMKASISDHLPVVQYLIQQGAAINVQDKDGDTALLLACREGKVDVVKVLLQAGADKSIQNKKGETALSVAKTEEIKKILVEYDQKNRKTLQNPPVNSAVEKAAEMRQPLEEYSQQVASNSHSVEQKPVKPPKPNKLRTQTDAVITSAQNKLTSKGILRSSPDLLPSPPSPVRAASADAAAASPSPPSPPNSPSAITPVEKDPEAAGGTWYRWLSKTVTTLTVPAVQADANFCTTYFCNSHTIILSELTHNKVAASGRLILHGHFEVMDWREDLQREQCIIKHCGATDALSGASSPEVIAMRREYEIYQELQKLAKTASTKSTGCVRCFSAHPGFQYLVLEYFGQDLRSMLKADLKSPQLVLEGIIPAVQALHSHNIMHGDIKPENILYQFDLTGNCMVKLCDLDCAYRCGVDCPATSLGTRYYTAPEVCIAAAQGHNVKASLDKDMFSLGLVLWQVLKRSAAPALQLANPTQLQRMYTDQAALDSFLKYAAPYQAILSRVTSLDPTLRPGVTDLWKDIKALSASNAHQNWIHVQAENKFLKSSVVDKLTSLDEKLTAGQVKLGEHMRTVLRENAALAEMLQTVLTGCHDIPTYCVIVPIVAKNWADVVSPMRLMQNQYRLYFLCAHTHQIAPCGDKGKGYKIKVHKQWVKDAAPALQVGLVLLKLGLLAGGIPLPIPDLCSILQTVDQHVQFLDAAFDLLQNPPVDSIMEDYVMSKKLGELPNIQSKDVMQTKDMEKSYSAIKSILEGQGVNIPLTCGLRKVTDCSGRTGKTAWVLDNDATEQAWRNSQ